MSTINAYENKTKGERITTYYEGIKVKCYIQSRKYCMFNPKKICTYVTTEDGALVVETLTFCK